LAKAARAGDGALAIANFNKIDNELSLKTISMNGPSSSWGLHFPLVDRRSSAETLHVFDNDGKIITRVNLDTMEPMDVPKMDRRIVELIRELREEGRF